MKRIKVGIAGLGRLGMAHAKNIAFNIPNAELIAVCSILEEETQSIKANWGIPYAYTDYNEMIQNKELEAVVIVSPSPLHVTHISAALEAGLHVFTEKPLGVTVEDCKTAEKAVEAHPNQVFMIGFMRRYDPSYLYAKQLIDNGKIGKPFLIRCTSCDPENAIDGFLKFMKTSGGMFLDMTVHDIDLARWLLDDEVSQIYAIGGAYCHPETDQYGGDNTCALMRFKGNGMAFFYSGRDAVHGYQVETEIVGTNGSLRIGAEPAKNMCVIYDDTGILRECSQSFQERFFDAYRIEMQEFIDCIIENRRPSITVYDGTKNTEVAFAATAAFRENKLVIL